MLGRLREIRARCRRPPCLLVAVVPWGVTSRREGHWGWLSLRYSCGGSADARHKWPCLGKTAVACEAWHGE
jgi:hypothetical protein